MTKKLKTKCYVCGKRKSKSKNRRICVTCYRSADTRTRKFGTKKPLQRQRKGMRSFSRYHI